MRRIIAFVFMGVALLVVLGTAGCGQGNKTAQAVNGMSAQDIISKMLQADAGSENVNATFDLSLQIKAGSATSVPDEATMFMQGPVKVSGTLVTAKDPQALDMSMTASVGDGSASFKMGLRSIGEKAWIQVMGQWYEAPPELLQSLAGSKGESPQLTELKGMLDKLGIDPRRWAKELTVVGTEPVDDGQAYRVHIVPDVQPLIADAITIFQSKEFKELVGGQMTEEQLQQIAGVGDEELKEAQQMAAQVVQNASVDVWAATDDFALRKLTAQALLKAPPGEEANGPESVDLKLTALLKETTQPVKIEAPATAKPWKDLQGLFGGEFNLFGAPSSG